MIVTTPGVHTLDYWSEDNVGNIETRHRVTFEVIPTDHIPPRTSCDATSSYTTTATISLWAVDEGGSGLGRMWHQLDDEPATEGSTFQVATVGEHTLRYWSVDRVGNVEATHTVSFLVLRPDDHTAPVTTADVRPSYVGTATIWLTASDGQWGSGVRRTLHRVDGGPTHEGANVIATGVGAHMVEFWSEDASGNVEATRSAMFVVSWDDATPPVTRDDAAQGYVGHASISLTATDGPGSSGVAQTRYSLDGAPEVDGTGIETSAVGQHVLVYWSTDRAGNVEDRHTVRFRIWAATALTLKTSTRTTRGRTTLYVSGVLTPGASGEWLTLTYRLSARGPWSPLADVRTRAGGRFSFSAQVRRGTWRLRAAYSGNEVYVRSSSPVVTQVVR